VSSDSKPVKLGELLIAAGLLTSQTLEDAIRTASETGLPIGRVLIMSGAMSDNALQGAISAQSMVKDQLLAPDNAVEVLKLIAQLNIPLEQALTNLNFQAREEARTTKLGQLLTAAQVISERQLGEALKSSQETGLPLGRILVLTQAITETMLSAALTAQVLVRDGKVTREQAIEGLSSARRRRVSIETSLADHGYFRPPVKQSVKLGELYVLSDLLLESDLMTALEKSLVQRVPIGQIFLQAGLTTNTVLEAALKVQEMVANGTLNSLQASQALRQVAMQRFTLSQALADLGAKQPVKDDPFQIGDILKAANIVTEEDIKKAIELSVKNSGLFGRMLLSAGFIDDALLNSTLRAQFLIREGFLNMEQAIIALTQCRQTGQPFDEVIQQLGWTFPTRASV
jgi:hypothetical protein